MKRLVLILLLALVTMGQITIPNTFSPQTVISSTAVNTNFSTLGTNALNRAGGTLTGNMTVSSDFTIDGVDISDYLLAAGKILSSSTAADAIDVAGGVNAGSGNVGIIGTDGKIPALTTTYIANLSAATLTGVHHQGFFALGGIADVGISGVADPSWTDVPGTMDASVNGDTIGGFTVVIQAQAKASAGTGKFRLFNVTAGSAVASSDTSFTNTSYAFTESVAITLAAGVARYKLQINNSSSANTTSVHGARLVIR